MNLSLGPCACAGKAGKPDANGKVVYINSIEQVLHETKVPLKPAKIKDLLKDVCRGMAYLHGFSPPILHRDLKPANLLVTKTLQVKICDFGLSQQTKIIGGGNDDEPGTRAASRASSADADDDDEDDGTGVDDQLGGTAPYSAPEVLLGKELDVGCDIFSFGVIIWEFFTRRRPWDGVHAARISQLVGFDDERLPMSDEVESLGDGSIKAIIEQCWQLKTGDRPKFPVLIDKIDEADAGV
jgi:serine/threonine protein kinase